MLGKQFLARWLAAEPPRATPVAISLCDEAGKPVVVWHIKEAIPTKLSAPGFDVNDTGVAIETLELLAGGISVEHV